MAKPARARPGEFELIARFFAPLARNAPGAFGLSDDAAVLAPRPEYDLVLKTDAVVEDVDFFRADPAAAIARKALRVNLSDLAAKGAGPVGYLMTLLVPDWPDEAWFELFASGLAADQAEFELSLMGGDISGTSGPLAISIAAFGYVPAGAMIRRAGAKPGDGVYVSGTIGDAGAGLSVLQGEGAAADFPELVSRYRIPEPRCGLGAALRGIASSALDVSDGLIADLGHLAQTAHVRIEVESDKVPLSAALRKLWGSDRSTVARAATAGDDYEIAFTAPPEREAKVAAAAAASGVKVTRIGSVLEGEGVVLRNPDGAEVPLPRKGYTHF